MSSVLFAPSTSPITSKKSTSAFHKTAFEIHEKIGVPLISTANQLQSYFSKNLNVIACVYETNWMAYKEYKELIDSNPNATLIMIVQEYEFPFSIMSSYFGKRKIIVTGQNVISKKSRLSVLPYIACNVNSFSLNDVVADNYYNKTDLGVIYWGRFRKGRVRYFMKYKDDIIISTSKKNVQDFLDAGINGTFCEPLDWDSEHKYNNCFSLYLEDEYSHINYTYPGTRFYESINMNMAMLFDSSCKNTFDKYGVDIIPFLFKKSRDYDYFFEVMGKQKSWIPLVANEKVAEMNILRNLLT